MIEVLNSKRMTLVIVILIIICTVVVIIEEWFTNSQLVISTILNHDEESNIINYSIPDNIDKLNLSNKPLNNPLPKTLDKINKSGRVNWRQYFLFLSSVSFFGGIAGLLVKYRQLQLRTKSLARFRKHTDSDDSNHTLINMNFTT